MACIKTLLLSALKTDIESISAIAEVSMNPYVKPLDGDYLKTRPYCVLIDQPEKILESNRYRRAEFELVITTLVYQELSENLSSAMDEIQAQIYLVIKNTGSSFRQYCQKWKEVSAEKMYINENEGALIQIFSIDYLHDTVDPYTVNP